VNLVEPGVAAITGSAPRAIRPTAWELAAFDHGSGFLAEHLLVRHRADLDACQSGTRKEGWVKPDAKRSDAGCVYRRPDGRHNQRNTDQWAQPLGGR
jgi:hypothetical protein